MTRRACPFANEGCPFGGVDQHRLNCVVNNSTAALVTLTTSCQNASATLRLIPLILIFQLISNSFAGLNTTKKRRKGMNPCRLVTDMINAVLASRRKRVKHANQPKSTPRYKLGSASAALRLAKLNPAMTLWVPSGG
jgi:hypothetical protein